MTERETSSFETAVSFGPFQLIPTRRILLEGERTVRLGNRAMDLLVALVDQAGQTVRKDELMARAWPDTTVDEGSLRVHISTLRKILGDGSAGIRFIANVAGRGYSFVAPTTRDRLAGLPATNAAIRGNDMPASPTRIVGRGNVIEALVQRLARNRLLTIVGPGGIGKTTVAAAVADRVRSSFADGVWFVGLASLQSPDLVPNAVGAVLGIPHPDDDVLAGITTWLRDRHALLVLDNCEHVVDAVASLVEMIARSAPRVSVLVTSREPLRAEGESRHRLAPLELPPASGGITRGDALSYAAVQLFVERAAASFDDFNVDVADMAAIVEICRRLDGVPLALELAAAHIGVLGVNGLAARLDHRFALLIHGRRTALPRHQTLRATLDWSYDLLPATEQGILRRVAVFQGNFTVDAATCVAEDAGLADDAIFSGIANLVDKSLLTADISGETPYYHLLEITHAYALEKLHESGERDLARRLHAQYFHQLFTSAESAIAARPRDEWLTDQACLIDNLRAALDWAFASDGDVSIGISLAAALPPFWVQMSAMSECRRYVERALASLKATATADPHIEMTLNAALGAALTYTTGPVPETVAAWTRTLQLAEALGDTEYRLRALRGLWSYRMNAGEYRAALALANEFCELAARQADPQTLRAGDRMAALILHYLGEQADARKRIEWTADSVGSVAPSLPATRFMLEQGVAAQALLARILWLQGFPDQAMRAAETALEQAEAAEHAISVCHALAQAVCPVTLWTGDLDAAERFVAMLIDLASQNALLGWIARSRCLHGVLLIRRGLAADGTELLRAALLELQAAGSTAEFPLFRGMLAQGLGLMGQVGEGLAAIDDAIQRSESSGELWCAAELLRIKAELLVLSHAADADGCFRLALDIARRQGTLAWELRAAIGLARSHREVRDATRGLLAGAYNRFSEGFDTADLMAARLLLEVPA